ncbi:MAG: FHA domain-containing protein [Myxococcota bacterium]|nr:FHA domain-containing protein [Myxococcota bacterium]
MSIQRMKHLMEMAKDARVEGFLALCPAPILVTLGVESSEENEGLTKGETRIRTQEHSEVDVRFDPNVRVFEVKKRPDLNEYPDMIIIGRSTTSDIQLHNAEISKMHAYVSFVESPEGRKFQIVDGNSRNGTWIKRIRLSPHKPRMLDSGDIIRFGASVLMAFYYPEDLFPLL